VADLGRLRGPARGGGAHDTVHQESADCAATPTAGAPARATRIRAQRLRGEGRAARYSASVMSGGRSLAMTERLRSLISSVVLVVGIVSVTLRRQQERTLSRR
jgi:hypothetical protein